MPVHLGSMSESIKTVIERNPAMQPGDVYVLNDPYHGGTHLPDVTVVTPVYLHAVRRRASARRSTSPAAATTPTSAAARRAACRRSATPSTRKACCSTTSCSCATACCARPSCWHAARRRRLAGAQPAADHRRPARADRRQREGRAGTARDGGAVRPRHRGRLHAACAGQRRGIGAPRHHRAEGRRSSRCRWTTARRSP